MESLCRIRTGKKEERDTVRYCLSKSKVTAKQPNAQISTNGSRPDGREPSPLIPVHSKNWPYFGFGNKS